MAKDMARSRNSENAERFRQSFAATLRLYRQHANLTQAELAERCGISQQVVSAYENGTVSPAPFMLAVLARELRCKVQELADYTVS